MNTAKITLVAASVVSMVLTNVIPSLANPAGQGKEGFGRHSGFHGNGGLGRGGYNFGDKFEDKHPRRSQVLGRDNRLNYAVNKSYGRLDGQYGALKQEQRSIRRQAQADARANGGYITQAQKAQLNQQENQLRQNLKTDLSK